jgi:transposase InsO family protein
LREQSLKDGTNPLTLAQVKLVLSDNPVVQATAPHPKPGKIRYQSIVASAPNESWTVDLVFPDKTKVKAFLSCIDTYSRKGWLVHMTATDSKRGTAPQILAALKEVARAAGGTPANINSDLEFDSAVLNAWYSENNIKHWPAPPTTLHRSSLVERWHRTLRGLLLKFWLALPIKRELSVKDVGVLVETYNNNRHSTTQQRPEAMFDADGKLPSFQIVVSKEEATATVFKFEVGQRVSSLVKKAAFRGDASKAVFSERVYRISKITGARVSLETLGGEALSDTFAVYQLRPATGPDGGLAGDAQATTRDKAADRRKGVARGKRAFAKEEIDPGASTQREVTTRGARRATTAPATQAARLNRE